MPTRCTVAATCSCNRNSCSPGRRHAGKLEKPDRTSGRPPVPLRPTRRQNRQGQNAHQSLLRHSLQNLILERNAFGIVPRTMFPQRPWWRIYPDMLGVANLFAGVDVNPDCGHEEDSITRSIAGCFRFLTLTQCGVRPPTAIDRVSEWLGGDGKDSAATALREVARPGYWGHQGGRCGRKFGGSAVSRNVVPIRR